MGLDSLRTLSGLAVLAMGLAVVGCGRGEKAPDPAALVADLKSTDPAKSGDARLKIISLGEPAVPAVVELLGSKSSRERLVAATTLWGMGPRAAAAVPALGTALSDPDVQVRVTSAMALENVGPAAGEAVPALIRALRDRERPVRQAAVKALGAIGPAARSALPALTREIARESWPEAEEAVRRIRQTESGTASPEATR